jgi:secreted trypsin-like serine protease
MKIADHVMMTMIFGTLLCGCTADVSQSQKQVSSQPKIVNGEQAAVEEFPFMVSIKRKTTTLLRNVATGQTEDTQVVFSHVCGGTLIADNLVLTAAHCLEEFVTSNDDDMRADVLPCDAGSTCMELVQIIHKGGSLFVGEYSMIDESEAEAHEFSSSDIIIHPEYHKKTAQNDIAVIKLKTPTLRKAAVLGRLERDRQDQNSHPLTVIGFGRQYGPLEDAAGRALFPTVLQKAQVPVVEPSLCKKHYENLKSRRVIDEKVICAGDYYTWEEQQELLRAAGKDDAKVPQDKPLKRDACNFDSGGPLLESKTSKNQRVYEVVGIVSWGIGCAVNPGVYTRIEAFESFLAPIAAISSSKSAA